MTSRIDLKYVASAMEKTSAIHGEAIKKVLTFAKKHPWLTMGTVIGVPAVLSNADKVIKAAIPTYYVVNENKKKNIMNEQTSILRQLRDASNKKPNPDDKYRKPLIQPLA